MLHQKFRPLPTTRMLLRSEKEKVPFWQYMYEVSRKITNIDFSTFAICD